MLWARAKGWLREHPFTTALPAAFVWGSAAPAIVAYTMNGQNILPLVAERWEQYAVHGALWTGVGIAIDSYRMKYRPRLVAA